MQNRFYWRIAANILFRKVPIDVIVWRRGLIPHREPDTWAATPRMFALWARSNASGAATYEMVFVRQVCGNVGEVL